MSIINEIRHRTQAAASAIIKPIIQLGKHTATEFAKAFIYHYSPLYAKLAKNINEATIEISPYRLMGFFFVAPVAWLLATSFAVIRHSAITSLFSYLNTRPFLYLASEATPAFMDEEDERPWWQTHLLGSLGHLFGPIAAVVTMASYRAYKFIAHTAKSFASLSGSIFNVALNRDLSEITIGMDDRTALQKSIGSLGYITASLLVTPLGMLFFALRKLPTAAGYLTGLIFSPVVLASKGLKYLLQSEQEIPEQSDKTMSKFKILLSHLTPFGRLPEGKTLEKASVDQDSSSAFIIKSITLDTYSPTERIIHALVQAYKTQYPEDYKNIERNHPEFFDSEAFQNTIEEVVNYYRGDFFASSQEIEVSTGNVRKVAELIKGYMQSESQQVEISPTFYHKPFEPSYFALLHGTPVIEQEKEEALGQHPNLVF